LSGGSNMSIEVEAALPSSQRALKAIAEAGTWATDSQEMWAKSNRRAWQIAGAGVVLGLMGFATGLFQSLRPPAPPVPVVVDRITGEAMVVPQLTADTVPQIAAVDQHHAAVYVRARESYAFNFLKRDYEQVARMSTPESFAPYNARFIGESAMQTKIGTAQEHRISIVSARPSTTSKAGREGEVIVTFDKEIKITQGISPAVGRYVATVKFEYRPKSIKRDVDRIENPLGFVVLSYRTEAELVNPTNVSQAGADGASQQRR
jgi:type IV secretion system protein VirB8